MISENYKKSISIFIFSENVYLARAIKDRLGVSEYEVHFYTDENLVRQAVYLALPHIVILPSTQRYEKLLLDIRKMSREIQLLVLAPEDDYEAVLALKRKGLINDFIIDPLKYLDSIPYRVDLACERWVLMSQVEAQSDASGINPKPPIFNSNMPSMDVSQDSILSDILMAADDSDAIRIALERVSTSIGKPLAYFDYNSVRDVLVLKDVSFGMRKDLEGLGVPLHQLDDISAFMESPSEYKVYRDFLLEIFSASETQTFAVQTGGEIFGFFVALAPLNSDSAAIIDRTLSALAIKIDNAKKTRTIHNYLQVDKEYGCLSNKVFYAKISDEISRSRRLELPVSLLVFDITSINRAEQKYAASVVSKVLKRFTRVTDLVGKVGQYRFGVLLPHCSMSEAVNKARKLQAIVKAAVEENKISSAIVRAGVTAYPDQHSDAMSLLDAAERACAMASEFEVCLIEGPDDKNSIRDRIKDRIKGASL